MKNSAFENPNSEIVSSQSNHFTSLVARVMRIEATTWGSQKERYLLKYRGQLLLESDIAYDQLAEALKPHQITPMFRIEDEQPTIILLDGVIEPKPSNPWVNLVLFVLTVVSVLLAGTLYSYQGPVSEDSGSMIRRRPVRKTG